MPTGDGPHEAAITGGWKICGGGQLRCREFALRHRHRYALRFGARGLGRVHAAAWHSKVVSLTETTRSVARFDPGHVKIDWLMGTGASAHGTGGGLARWPKKLYTSNIVSNNVTGNSPRWPGECTGIAQIAVGLRNRKPSTSPRWPRGVGGPQRRRRVSIIDSATNSVSATLKSGQPADSFEILTRRQMGVRFRSAWGRRRSDRDRRGQTRSGFAHQDIRRAAGLQFSADGKRCTAVRTQAGRVDAIDVANARSGGFGGKPETGRMGWRGEIEVPMCWTNTKTGEHN